MDFFDFEISWMSLNFNTDTALRKLMLYFFFIKDLTILLSDLAKSDSNKYLEIISINLK